MDLTDGMKQEYHENIKNVTILSPENISELTETSYIYFGRVTCPYCRKFSQQIAERNEKIYYIDTENTEHSPILQAVREQYNAPTIPTFIKRKPDGSFVKLNRDVRQTIEDFINENQGF